jgi:hypothetical protein
MDKTAVKADTFHFTRKLRLKEKYFHDQNSTNDENNNESTTNMFKYGIQSQAISRLLTPAPGRNDKLDEFCTSITNHLITLPNRLPYDNLSQGERDALIDFSKTINQEIVIKPADKGGAIVIQDTSDYIETCMAILSDGNFYRKLSEDPTPQIHSNLLNLLKDLSSSYNLQDLKIKDLVNRYPGPGRFYTLPKIHKLGNPPPGRPIVSGNGTVTEVISSFADNFLKPLVPTLPSYIQDSTHFLKILESLKSIVFSPDTLVGTADVTSLYPNIPQDEGLEACKQYLNNRVDQDIPTDFLLSLMDFVLKNNNFTFNNEHYIQTQGTAMGTQMAPSYACLFMGVLEQKMLDQAPFKPYLWVRFIDDIFFIWTHGQEKWVSFLEYLNSYHGSIKFVAQVSKQSVPFLDMEVKLINGKIETDLYTKPTDCHKYLQWNSCHPRSTKKGIPYSQALRLRRICSNPIDFTKRLHMLEGYFRKSGYPPIHIKPAFDKVKAIPRLETLEYRDHRQNSRTTFPITYHPSLHDLPRILLEKHNNILLQDPRNKIIFKETPMVAYRRPKNLKGYLTRASLTPRSGANYGGFSNCSNPNCGQPKCADLHRLNVPGNSFTSTVTGKTYPISQTLNCNSHNIIYLVTCINPICLKQYVGESGRKHKDRAPEHVKAIETNIDTPIGRHFREPGHTIEDFTIRVIENCRKEDTAYRQTRESFWRETLKTEINKHKSRLHH